MAAHKNAGKPKRKIVFSTIETKKELIAKWESGVRLSNLALQYGMAKSTISTILKNKEAIKASDVAKGVKTLTSKRSQAIEEVEKLLMIWIKEKQLLEGDGLSEAVICEKARQMFVDITKDAPAEEFKASKGWFDNFKKRTGIQSVLLLGDTTSANRNLKYFILEMDNVSELTTMNKGEMEMKYDVADFVNIRQTFTSEDPLAENTQEDDHHEIARNKILVNAIPRIVQQQKNTSSTSTITNMDRETVRKRILATISPKPKKMKNDSLNSASKDADALDLFFEGIKSTMRQFSATDIHLVKTKIFSIVSEIEAKYLEVPETQTADNFEVVKVKVEPSDYNLEFCDEENDEKNVNILEERMIKEEVNSWPMHDDDPLYLGENLGSANAEDSERGEEASNVAEVAFRPVSECCKNNCHSIFNAERQMQMNSEFYGLLTSEEKDARVCAQIDVIGDDYRKERTRVYRLPDFSGFDVTVCKRMFCTVFNLTNDRLTYALSKKTFGAGKRS